MKNRFVGLIILDGYGLNKKTKGNAVKLANPENINYYFKNYPYTTLNASGEFVGLPKGQIGNSEVGHLNIGAGRVVLQSLQKINVAIKNKTFASNSAFNAVFEHVKSNNSSLHLIGLTSTGGVHSHINHLYELIKLAKKKEIKRVYIHYITDGRDVLRDSAVYEIAKLEKYLKTSAPNCKIATVTGRLYAMDREKNFDRTKLAYDAMVSGKAENKYNNPVDAIKESYKKEVYDEFIKPNVIVENNVPVAKISDNDGIIFYNYREDRARQLTAALVEDEFVGFERNKLNNIKMATFTKYDEKFKNTIIAFEKDYLNENLSQVVSENNLNQFKITETTKYAHVTYFLNGGIEKPYKNEERFLLETIKTERFNDFPKMRAEEITKKAVEEIKTKKYNLMVLNYSNPDMIGHTGDVEAAVAAIKCLNEQVKLLVDAILQINGIAIITADHGNAEEMISSKGEVLTDHTTNKVPFAIVGKNVDLIKLKQDGCLGNIAPTILELLNVKKPQAFTCDSLIINK